MIAIVHFLPNKPREVSTGQSAKSTCTKEDFRFLWLFLNALSAGGNT
jgi:hypothetical protein